jgi:ferredoxin-NADP reductase
MNQGIRGLITELSYVSPSLVKVCFRLSVGLKFHPGQGVIIDNQFHFLSGSPEESFKTNQYEILVSPQQLSSETSGRLNLRPAQLIQVEGPLGNFWPLSARPHQDVVWLSDPQGLAPFLAAIRSPQFHRVRPQKIVLIVEVSEEENLPFRELFEAHNVVVIPCITHPSKWVEGFWGKVQDLFQSARFNLDFQRAKFFISAEQESIEKWRSILVEEKNVASVNVVESKLLIQKNKVIDLASRKKSRTSVPLLRAA